MSHPALGTPQPNWLRLLYALLAGLFTVYTVLQLFFAGLGTLVNPSHWALHRAFGNLLGPLPIVLVLVGLLARLPRTLLILSALVLVLFVLQYVFLHAASALGLPALRALHAVNTLALFATSVHLTRRGWQSR